MREIKFRFYSNIEKKMHHQLSLIGLQGLEKNPPIYDADQVYCDRFEDKRVQRYSDGHLMQYTGLKDKNGVEIYEGDVLRVQGEDYPFEKEWIGIVKYIDGSYFIENLEGTDGDYLFNELREQEVIGNKYEHSHLLEVSK
ncbi:YopX family protein [Fictibacillus aquaticus]|uniref:YopX protein domain-containing protein n=1 Tax=Fictibacillus aquaticus TaxID=2021314 RepID=A0A235FB77_9BACL|nr:YopX family protein [Fictibacillus aquaticus]OYD58439.1 hypothetical protein CGZ90_00620 [Fictibacillus aquaticus]